MQWCDGHGVDSLRTTRPPSAGCSARSGHCLLPEGCQSAAEFACRQHPPGLAPERFLNSNTGR
jgi:hypothetical protein